MCRGKNLESGQLHGVGSLFPPRGPRGFNSGCQAGQQFPLPTEPFNPPRNLIFVGAGKVSMLKRCLSVVRGNQLILCNVSLHT